MRLILYSKPGCHLCEGLQEKLEQIQNLSFELEIRDITIREDWYQAYQYEVPVLYLSNHTSPESEVILESLPRPSPRATVQQLEQMLYKYISKHKKNNAE
ncbi:glutaredoxin family protein [Nostoc sp. UHCC 0702]|nr:glutaredoxin family protein [Nostoc sp. UHCC 0702]